MRTKKQVIGDNYENITREILSDKRITWTKNSIYFDLNGDGKIKGKSKCVHQIDVHLLSSLDCRYHLICECKCHKKKAGKPLVSSFIAIIDDIRKEHKSWIIIPVYCSNKGFTKDALNILETFKVVSLDLCDVSNRKIVLTISETIISPDIKISRILLDDDSEASLVDGFSNVVKGDILRARNLLNYYELVDESGNIINDIANHIGKFKTTKRKFVENKDDIFVSLITSKPLKRIEGEVLGKKTISNPPSKNVIPSETKCVLKFPNGKSYRFLKNGSIEKIKH